MSVLDSSKLHEWQAFHSDNRNQFVKERDPEQLARAARDRKLFVLRDGNGGIRASCGSFEYGDGTYREIGAVRVLDEGFSLQVVLMSAVVVSEWMFDPPTADMLAVTAQDNHASIKNIQRTGFVQVTALEPARMKEMNLKSLNPDKVYFEFPNAAIGIARAQLEMVWRRGGAEKLNKVMPVQLNIPVMQALGVQNRT